MTIENPAFSPLIILLAVGLYGLVHSLLASLQVKALAAALFGDFAEKYYRLFYNVFAFITLVPIMALPYTLPNKTWYTIPQPWTYLTLSIQLLVVGLAGIAALQTDVFKFIGLKQVFVGGSKDVLKTRGIYKHLRHPLYSFGIVFLWLSPSMSQNMAALYFAFTLYFIFGAMVEERKLVRVFGKAYQDYRAKTPMFIPFIK
ncbi:MAG: isoprenylcysteine carboxylmethyltransferase family protein [Anaerolineales bacterium]|jgi:protein-S-isoprenylcysteine O-methyltransferase Ste14